MIVVLHIKIYGQIVEGISFPDRDIVQELLPRNPHGLPVNIRLIGQELAAAPVPDNILHHGGKIAQGLPQAVPVNLVVDELCQPPLRLRGDNPGVKLRVGQLKAEQLVHVEALLLAHKNAQQHNTQYHRGNFRTPFSPVRSPFHPRFYPSCSQEPHSSHSFTVLRLHKNHNWFIKTVCL